MNLTRSKLDNLAQIKLFCRADKEPPSLLKFYFSVYPGAIAKMSVRFLVTLTQVAILSYLLSTSSAKAQIIPDSTLPTNSSVNNQDDTSVIEGGTANGPNLFHSFDSFSVPTGTTAYFNNPAQIENIISRVTGRSVSNIDGAITTNGAANLFLLNPNGMIFGPNARLNVGGSFLASTASSVQFADGAQFSTTAPQTTPLLTVSVPIGLQLGSDSGAIRVIGNGHNVIASNYQPIMRGNSSTLGLQVQPQRMLAIVGGDISLEGGVLTAEAGRIELGSVDNGLVSLDQTSSGWSLGYEGVSNFKDIRLTGRALVDASGAGSGSIQVQGRRLQLSDSSLVLIQNQGVLPTGNLTLNAAESLEIRDDNQSGKVYSGIWSETLGFGDGGEIIVSTPDLTLQSSGQIFSSTFGAAGAASITLSVPKSLRVNSLFSTEVGGGTIIGSLAIGSGRSGDITISALALNIANGGIILTANATPITSNLVAGQSGDISISATDFVEVNGTAPNLSIPSAISAATFSTGRAGNVTISTSRLRVKNGGRIDSSTTALGIAGSVTINASDSIEVSGVAPGSSIPSLVTSTATVLQRDLQDLFGLFGVPSGVAGKVSINTERLTVSDGGQISVRNEGKQTAGDLEIAANSINLDNSGGITAETFEGGQGDIRLQSRNLVLANNSFITTTAGGRGDGGNLNINTDIVVISDSDITANAFEGRGGNIQINTQALLSSSNSTISASSQLGINGNVQIDTLDTELSRTTATAEVIPETPEVVSVCQGHSRAAASQFIITGTGGILPSPNDLLSSNTGWYDNFFPSGATNSSREAELPISDEPTQLVEAQGWRQNLDGSITLTAEASGVMPYSSLATPACDRPSTSELPRSNRNAAR